MGIHDSLWWDFFEPNFWKGSCRAYVRRAFLAGLPSAFFTWVGRRWGDREDGASPHLGP